MAVARAKMPTRRFFILHLLDLPGGPLGPSSLLKEGGGQGAFPATPREASPPRKGA